MKHTYSDLCARHNSLLINLRRNHRPQYHTEQPQEIFTAQERAHRYTQGTASWPWVGIEPTTPTSAQGVGGKADLPLSSRPPGPHLETSLLVYITLCLQHTEAFHLAFSSKRIEISWLYAVLHLKELYVFLLIWIIFIGCMKKAIN